MQKTEFKVLGMLPKKNGGTYWMTLGSGYRNADNSINVYLDALPRGEWRFQLRELTEEDLRKREAYRTTHASSTAPPSLQASPSSHANDSVPF